jgi:hypothetical protein
MTPKSSKKSTPLHPMELDVGFKKFKIIQAPLTKDNLYGCVEFTKNTLTIDPAQDLADYKSTLLHEIFHIGFDIFGLGEDEDMPTIGNEFLTSVSSNMVILIASLNRELFEFIFSDE